MLKRLFFLFFSTVLLFQSAFSQTETHYKWWNPAKSSFPVIEGQGWYRGQAHPYDRLPTKAKNEVRKVVWHLSEESAGLVIRFRSNASDIIVRYVVESRLNMPHMPSTGVSGVDLYAFSKDGRWEWAGGKYHFGDTIEYHFSSLSPGERQYHLYLPLYNKVNWMEIGVPKSAIMKPLRIRTEKPIVIYGTSITQGGVASRPGLAWPAILGRKLNTPIVNLGFSGNGKLERSVTNLLTELNAKMYVLDCMGNMTRFPKDTIAERLEATVQTLHTRKPNVPILLVEDSNPSIKSLNIRIDSIHRGVNNIEDSVFAKLKASGMKNIYLMTSDSIGLDIKSTVDGLHPNDYGMILYANAYEKMIHEILHEKMKDN